MDYIFNCYQGIILVLLLFTLFLRTLLLYIKEGINPFVLGKDKTGISALLESAFVILLMIWAYEVLAAIFRFHFHVIPWAGIHASLTSNTVVRIAGILFQCGGYIILLLSLITFGKSWRIGIDKRNPGKLVTNGIFLRTRNPIFLSLDLFFTGTALLNATPFLITFAVVSILGIHYQILQEEKFLTASFGEKYLAYKKNVPRYV